MSEQVLKEKIFGSVRKMESQGNLSPDEMKLLTPFKWKEAAVRSFCQGCGHILEIGQEGVKELAKLASLPLPTSLEGYYFLTKACVLCQGKDFSVKLKRITRH